MKIYHWKGKRNFGDLLTGLLLKKFTGLSSEWVEPANSELVMVGSILGQIPSDYRGVIAGCGKIKNQHCSHFSDAKILALRGPLTAESITGNYVLADPGLLADELVGPQDKLYDLGIVPHWSDSELEFRPEFTKYYPKIIRVDDDPLQVIREIGQCKKIVSSSLHGIILADAFGIPRRVEMADRVLKNPYEGGTFKFEDYSLSIGKKLLIGKTEEVNRNIIIDKQHELFDVLQEVKSIFK
jgi:pyruvyltransferase